MLQTGTLFLAVDSLKVTGLHVADYLILLKWRQTSAMIRVA